MSVAATSASELIERLEQRLDRPLRAMIEVSDRCNEVCVHCYQVQGQKGEMTTEQVRGVIDDLADQGVLFLTFSGGEATLRPDLLDLIRHARIRGFAVRLYTNGLTMTESYADALAALAVHEVEISLYSHRAEVHDFVTGVPRSFERSVAGIRRLTDRGVRVTVKTPAMSVNEAELEVYADFVTGLGAHYGFDPGDLMAREGGDRAPEALSVSPAARAGLKRRLLADGVILAPTGRRSLEDVPCGAGRVHHVEPNGEIRPCTMLDLNLGNAVDGGLAAARGQSANLDGLLALTWADLHGCRECDLRHCCARCYAAARTQAGDALGPYASACSLAVEQFEGIRGVSVRFSSATGRDPTTGPYRDCGDGVLEPFEDVVTEADELLARRLAWTRRPPAAPRPDPVRPGNLVQIRRPGRSRPRVEQVPGLSGGAVATEENA